MAVDVLIPNAGQASGEATIIRWQKKAGDAVRQGEVLLEVETDKATMEVEATATGVLQAVRYAEGDVVPVLTVVAVIARNRTLGTVPRRTPTQVSLPHLRKYPSRPKVCLLADRYIFCGRSGE